jgi:site-specific DNA-methyltransferase (adenine-specific)
VAALFTDWRQLPVTTDGFQAGGWVQRGIAVWDKTAQARPALGGIRPQAEFVVWGTAGPATPDINPVTLEGVYTAPTLRGDDKLHIAQKPEAVMRWLCQLCPPGGLIVDPFMGSGSTLRAALDTGRRVIGIDHDERNCAIAASRLQQVALSLEAVS